MTLAPGAIQVIVVSFIATSLAIVALALRLWSKNIQCRRMAFHDYMVCVAMVFAAGTVSVFLAAAFSAGLGLHLDYILATDPALSALHLKLFVPAQLLWAAANTCVKISILSLYTSLFPGRRFILLCHGTMVVTLAYFISVLVETFVLCKPVQFNWDKSIAGTCGGQNIAYLVSGITNLVIDVFVIAMPMPMLWGLDMSVRKRLGVIGMFSLGTVICIMSMLRVIWLHSWDLTDMTYTATPGAIYSVLEPMLGVVNACLPTIKPAIANINRQRAQGLHRSSKVKNSGTRNLGLSQPPTALHSPGFDVERLGDDITLVSIYIDPDAGTNASNASRQAHHCEPGVGCAKRVTEA